MNFALSEFALCEDLVYLNLNAKPDIQILNGLYYALRRVAKQVDILKAIRHRQQAHHFCNAVK